MMHDYDACSQGKAGRPFPWFCPECGKKAVWRTTVPYTTRVRHDDELYAVDVPGLRVPRCEACGEVIFDIEADEQISQALRTQLGLLSPDDIRSGRERLALGRQDLAKHLGVAAATVSEWEEGLAIQSRAMDRFLRVYFQSPEGRAAVIELAAAAPHA